MCGVPARMFGGGRHASGCRYRHQCCCIATTGMGAMMMLSLSPSMARAVFLCARVVNGRRRRRVPTWPLLGCCLYLLFSSSFLLSSPFPTPHHFLPISLLRVRIERVGNPAFGLAQGRWWWWVGWPTDTSWLHGGGDATPVRVASRDVLMVVGVGEVGTVCDKVVIWFDAV
jgi:hypothetical protein